jgi:IS1 family transposase
MTGRGAFVLLAAFAACQSDKAARVDFSETQRDYLAKDYHEVYERWTRHDFVSRDAEKAIELWATFKSWDFREAYIERYSAMYSIPDADRVALRQHEKNALHEAYEFHVTAQSANYKWNDLEKKSSPWRFVLLDALGHELQPESIRVEKLPEVVEKEFYPAKTPFTKAYVVRFVAPPNGEFAGVGSGSIVLRLSSPAGRVELSWRA